MTDAATVDSWQPDGELLWHTVMVCGRNADDHSGRLGDLLGINLWQAAAPVTAGDLHPAVLMYALALAHGEDQTRDAYLDPHRRYGGDVDRETVNLYLDELRRIDCPHHDRLTSLLDDVAVAAAAPAA
jgi:hypothetical protein